ncbi:MAG: M23 family metallopeptidase [Syntrophomonadaceae bacterium]|nr:M23 family metallopeptidase [Syntrophomonadaceae bacterium]
MRRRKRKFKDENITILLVPGSTRQTHTISCSRWVMRGLVATVVAFLVSFVWLGYTLYAAREDIKNIHSLKQESAHKTKQLEEMGARLRDIQAQKLYIEEQQEEVKRLMGISQTGLSRGTNPSRGAMGGGEERTVNPSRAEDTVTEMEQLQEYLEACRNELDHLTAEGQRNRQYYLALPNNCPVAGRITSEFGWRKSPFGKRQEHHGGVDVAADLGTPVRAAAQGKVAYVGRDRVYGRLIKIDHGNGYITWYGHNWRVMVKEGDEVRKGQMIARVGSSGRSSGPHLHFAIEKNGHFLDPLLYLPGERG